MGNHQVGDLLVRVKRPGKVPKSKYLADGEFPVIDQGQGQIAGYTNNPDVVLYSPLPLTVFGDHTRAVKFVKEPFASGADGTQLLYPDTDKVDPTFFFYAIKNIDLSNYFYARHFKFLKEQEIWLPPHQSQIRIASTLSGYDNLIDNNRQRIQLLEQSARILYKEWFIHLRFPGHERIPVTDGVPEGWKFCGMLDHPHFELIRENIGAFDGFKRYYATADITGIDITSDGIDYNFGEKPSRAQKAPEVGSVWFARMQETHKVLVFTKANRSMAEGAILSSGFAGFRARRAVFLPWLYLLINNARFHEKKDCYCTGATQRSLTNGGLKRIQVTAPPGPIVGAFSDLAGPIIEQILILQALNRQLMQARDLLLPRLMSGEMRL